MKQILMLLVFVVGFLFADDFLEPKDAFKPSFKNEGNNIVFELGLGKNIYIYADKLKFKDGNTQISNLKLPTPTKHDEFVVYEQNLSVSIDTSTLKNGELVVEFQGCSADGLCYQPMSEKYPLSNITQTKPQDTTKLVVQNETDSITNTLQSGSVWVVLLTFFGFGLLLSLTPCVFPMIPILSSILVKHSGENAKGSKSFLLSVVYVLSMAFAYTIAGVVAGIFGANLQAALQNPVALSLFALVFVVLAFSMFGYFEIGLPASIQSKLSKKSDEQQGGFVGTAVMGFLSALIVGPCVAPPLAGALVYIGQSGDALLGGAALFVMSIGMGMPLLAIGLGADKILPKAGMWMMNVTKVFGVIMLGVAIWMLERILPSSVSLFLWALLFIGSSVYMGAFEPSKNDERNEWKIIKVIALLFFIYGTILFASSLAGGKSFLNPMEPFVAKNISTSGMSGEIVFEKVATLEALDEAIKKSDKPVLVDFYADWCTSCKEYDEITFKDASVINALGNFRLLRVDVTKNSAEDKKLLEKFGLFGPPALIFYGNDKEEMKQARLVGYKNPQEFLAHIKTFKE